jgi:hypothetical protein
MQARTISQATELARALEGRLREMWRLVRRSGSGTIA